MHLGNGLFPYHCELRVLHFKRALNALENKSINQSINNLYLHVYVFGLRRLIGDTKKKRKKKIIIII